MDKFFANAYRGDPGIPHTGPEAFENIWIGTAIFAVWGWNRPYFWQICNEHNYHDLAMLYEQYHVKKARAKKRPHHSVWNTQEKKCVTRTTSTGLIISLSDCCFSNVSKILFQIEICVIVIA